MPWCMQSSADFHGNDKRQRKTGKEGRDERQKRTSELGKDKWTEMETWKRQTERRGIYLENTRQF